MTKLQRTVLFVSILASFISMLDGFAMNVALPAISNELGGGLLTQQWVTNAYLISLGTLMLLAGSLSDVFGRKRILIIGLVGFGITSLLCALAPSALFLIIARGLQGMAGALLVPSSLALIISHFSGSAQGKAIGSWTAWTSIAAVAGPLIGGLVVDLASWRWILAINVIPIAYTLWLTARLDTPKEMKRERVDVTGAILGIVGLGGIVYALIEQTRYGWESPLIYIPLGVGILASATFLFYERRTRNPMLPLHLFAVRNFRAGNVATVFVYAALSLSTFILTIYLQQGVGFSALEAGMAFLPVTLIMFLLSPRIGRLAGKYGPRWFMASGPAMIALGFLLLYPLSSPVNYWFEVLPGVLLFGTGLSITVTPLTTAVLGSIQPSRAGIASAVNNAISRVAGLMAIAAIGIAIGPSLSTPDAFRRGILAMVILALLGGLVSALGIRNEKVVGDSTPVSTVQ